MTSAVRVFISTQRWMSSVSLFREHLDETCCANAPIGVPRCWAAQLHLTVRQQLSATSMGALCNVAVLCLLEAKFGRGAGDGVYSKTAQRVHLRTPVAFLTSGLRRSLRLSPWVLSLVLSAEK